MVWLRNVLTKINEVQINLISRECLEVMRLMATSMYKRLDLCQSDGATESGRQDYPD